ncbi:PAS domain-containing sensor histidine kinase [Vibrio sp. WXL210]|uniref:PAS domain-containing sensor histidine kinase n=1 Tax=Vibrio sp. WXL210 TaxID=3450709 RepID=UPI003EC8FE0C
MAIKQGDWMKLVNKVVISVSVICILCISMTAGLVAWQSISTSQEAIKSRAVDQLSAINESKKFELERHFQQIEHQIELYSNSPTIVSAVQSLSQAFALVQPGDSQAELDTLNQFYREVFNLEVTLDAPENDDSRIEISPSTLGLQYRYIANNPYIIGDKDQLVSSSVNDDYDRAHREIHSFMHAIQQDFGYYDVFLIDAEANIVYSVFKEVDFATNLVSDMYSDTGLARAFSAVSDPSMRFTHFEDFSSYPPSFNDPAAFVSHPIYQGEVFVGALVFQIPRYTINRIMTYDFSWPSVGLGQTGDSYLVANDQTLRSDRRAYLEDPFGFLLKSSAVEDSDLSGMINSSGSTIGLLQELTPHVTAFVSQGERLSISTDVEGEQVLVLANQLQVINNIWYVFSEISLAEAHADLIVVEERILQSSIALVLVVSAFAIVVSKLASRPISNPLLESDGGPNTWVQSLSKLETQNEILAKVATSSIDGITICDAHGRVIWVNRASQDINGFQLDDLMGKHYIEHLFSVDDNQEIKAKFKSAIDQQQPCQIELVNYRKSGERYWADINLMPLFDTAKQVSHLIAIERDISDRKQKEQALKASTKSANRANQAKSQFLATMTHELRTPLNGILGMANALRGSEHDQQEWNEALDVIEGSSAHLLTIVNDILDFSTLESDNMEFNLQPFALDELFSPIEHYYRTACRAEKIDFLCSVIPEKEWVKGDVVRIRQVLHHLMSNAVKFTHQGRIELKGAYQDGQLLVTITDTGIGMSEAQLETIFEPFNQADNSTTRQYGGTGLGLTICHQLVTNMGGEITASSKLGVGSEFNLRLPLRSESRESRGESQDSSTHV